MAAPGLRGDKPSAKSLLPVKRLAHWEKVEAEAVFEFRHR